MSFQDDSKSPAAFTGDSDVFDLPDAFLQSPTTTERVVDTQSGFLVVVKRQTERISISVKRRLGTPPNSSVLLTPDESLKLSRILATSLTAEEFQQERVSRSEVRRRLLSQEEQQTPFSSTQFGSSQFDAQFDAMLPFDSAEYRDSDSQYGNTLFRDNDLSNFQFEDNDERNQIPPPGDDGNSRFSSLEQEALAGVAAARARKQGKRPWFRAINPRLVGVSCTVALVLSAVGISAGLVLNNTFGPTAPDSVNIPNPLTPEKIDGFARVYISDLLDFNPESYKISQIQAMSHMSQQLLERYWKETKFPLTNTQLKALPQKCTVMITEIQQKPIDVESAQVDIYAHMVQPNSHVMAPLHLKLKLGATADGTIRVIEQQDVTAAAPEPPGVPTEAPTPAAATPPAASPVAAKPVSATPVTHSSARPAAATPAALTPASVTPAAAPASVTPPAVTPAPVTPAAAPAAVAPAVAAPADAPVPAGTGISTYKVYAAPKQKVAPLSSAARRLKALDAKVAPMAITPPAKAKPVPAAPAAPPPAANSGHDDGTTSGDLTDQ